MGRDGEEPPKGGGEGRDEARVDVVVVVGKNFGGGSSPVLPVEM